MLVFFLAASFISVRLLTGCGEGLNILTGDNSTAPGGVIWTDWSYRRGITVTNSGVVQSDYQVNINLSTSNFTFGNADANGNDIRFNFNGTSLPYWIESWVPGTSASIWVKIPSIANPDTVIYLYYGNPGLSTASDFDNTFTKNSGFSSLVAQWHMDEGSGSTVDDSSSNANDGTITNATWAGSDGGKWYTSTTAGFSTGDSLTFNGTDTYVAVADSSSLDAANITISAWIKTGADVTSTQYIVSKWIDSDPNRSYAIGIETGKFIFLTSSLGTLATIDSMSIGAASINTWYHFAVTSDGTNKRVYINGTEVTPAKSWAFSIHASSTDLVLGNLNTATSNYFGGVIDEVSIYSTAFSSDQVKALSQRRKFSASVGAVPSVGSEEVVP